MKQLENTARQGEEVLTLERLDEGTLVTSLVLRPRAFYSRTTSTWRHQRRLPKAAARRVPVAEQLSFQSFPVIFMSARHSVIARLGEAVDRFGHSNLPFDDCAACGHLPARRLWPEVSRWREFGDSSAPLGRPWDCPKRRICTGKPSAAGHSPTPHRAGARRNASPRWPRRPHRASRFRGSAFGRRVIVGPVALHLGSRRHGRPRDVVLGRRDDPRADPSGLAHGSLPRLRSSGTPLGLDLSEGLPCERMSGLLAGKVLPATDRDIDIDGIQLDTETASTHLLRRDQRRARAAEAVENAIADTRAVLDGVSDERPWLHRWMGIQVVHPPLTEGVDARIAPQGGAVAPILA